MAKTTLQSVTERLRPTPGGCLEWVGQRNDGGYGVVSVGKVKRRVHVFIYEQANGPIGRGIHVHHHCENKLCGNLEHLEKMTASEHHRWHARKREAQRTHCCHGHSLSGEDLRINSQGRRVCLECARERNRRSREESAEARSIRRENAPSQCRKGHLYPTGNPPCVVCRRAVEERKKERARAAAEADGRLYLKRCEQNALKTHCPSGHEYTPENTYVGSGYHGRQCRICIRARKKAREKRRRTERTAA